MNIAQSPIVDVILSVAKNPMGSRGSFASLRMTTLKTGCALTLSLLIAGVLFCSQSCSFRVERDPGVIVESLPADPLTLNPIIASEIAGNSVNANIYESLLTRDYNTLEIKPKLAKRWEISPDHLTYTFWLRDDVKWHDGVPFTADDVIYTFEKIMDPKADASHLRSFLKDLKRIEKVGGDAVRFTYAAPYYKALENIGGRWIIPKHVFDDGTDFNSHNAGRNPIGTGPYRFVEWKTGRSIALERFDGYWGKKPDITGILFKIIPDGVVRFMLLKKGALDDSELSTIQWVKQTEGESFKSRFTKHRFFLPSSFYIAWNLRKPLFSDSRVRIAMTMFINRRAIVDRLLFGEGELISSNLYRFGPEYDKSIEPYPYDPRGAAKLLDEAGWIDHDGDGIRDRDGVPFRFSLTIRSGDKFNTSIALFLKEELSRVGIEMEIVQIEWATMLKFVKQRDYDAVSLATLMPFNADFYQVWHSSQAAEGANISGFADARADAILEEARREFDPEKRAGLYRELHAILHREEPVSFLFTKPIFEALAKRFTNVVDYKIGLDSFAWGVAPGPELWEW